jgi:HSP20 family protein
MVFKKKDKIVPARKTLEQTGWIPIKDLDEVFDRMRREMDRGLWDPFSGFRDLPVFREPRIDMMDMDDKVEIRADMPGIPKDKVEITFSDEGMEIKGEVEQEKKEEHKGYYHLERSSSSFYRRIALPDGIDPGKSEAAMQDGVLKIVLPKKEGPKEQKGIKVK